MVAKSAVTRQEARTGRQNALTAGFLVLVATMGPCPLAAQAPDPVLGTWELNLSKSSFSPGPPPRSETRVMVQDGAVIRATSRGVDASGNPTSSQWTVTYDGTEQKIAGSPDADSQIVKRIDPLRTETTIKKGGKVVQTAHREISRDGKTMTLTFKGVNAKGQTIHDVMVFERR
jgi:hypothetical protein